MCSVMVRLKHDPVLSETEIMAAPVWKSHQLQSSENALWNDCVCVISAVIVDHINGTVRHCSWPHNLISSCCDRAKVSLLCCSLKAELNELYPPLPNTFSHISSEGFVNPSLVGGLPLWLVNSEALPSWAHTEDSLLFLLTLVDHSMRWNIFHQY